MYEPVQRPKVYQLVAERLLHQIRQRRLSPGDSLPPEHELARRYGVGRSSVREALRLLESKGVIRSAGHGSFVVAEYGNALVDSVRFLLTLEAFDLEELYEIRKVLETEFAALAAARRTDGHLLRMEEAIRQMEAGLSSQTHYIEADLRFHLTVAEATRNRVAVYVMRAIRDPLHRALASVYYIPGSPQKSLAQHRSILEAVRAGDPGAARLRMAEHLGRVHEDIRRVLHTDGSDGRTGGG
ncbi:MAG: FadR/GntR family transcriptional regulator [Armatimonadota bacterium]|nr:FadR/GntR family transcriptional regulator [Armatimonadota bacterium]MDR5676552.1 FadR/GntR family transcriptional regulator [Armatimonadota bacterium]MDR5688433.1 FadR/GntR family transcriptional regulator [Armatimonadota bacterium]MDR7387141.1 FadR/GntR family transcriptional regulator [Armatimonadota bacterium]MDR7388950.1 FadR/GntR family transcriptional regulator [Armatimonadota bacterium]